MRRDPTPHSTRPTVRAAMLDLLSRVGDAASAMDEAELIASLRTVLSAGRAPTDELWDQYHRPSRDRLASVYARYDY